MLCRFSSFPMLFLKLLEGTVEVKSTVSFTVSTENPKTKILVLDSGTQLSLLRSLVSFKQFLVLSFVPFNLEKSK